LLGSVVLILERERTIAASGGSVAAHQYFVARRVRRREMPNQP
jgi:hypothetical protein